MEATISSWLNLSGALFSSWEASPQSHGLRPPHASVGRLLGGSAQATVPVLRAALRTTQTSQLHLDYFGKQGWEPKTNQLTPDHST